MYANLNSLWGGGGGVVGWLGGGCISSAEKGLSPNFWPLPHPNMRQKNQILLRLLSL